MYLYSIGKKVADSKLCGRGLKPGDSCFLELFGCDMVCCFKMQGKVVGICVSYRLGNFFKCKAACF